MASESFCSRFRAETGTVCELAWPVVITFTLQIGIQLSNIIVLGYLSETALAAASLGNLYINLFSNAPGSGLATAIDSLSSQAYGAKAFTRLGAVFQRAVLILITGSIVSVVFFVYAESVLLGLGQDAELATLSGRYVRILIIAIVPVQIFEAMKKHFQAHQLMLPPMLVAAATVVVNATLAYVLVHHTELGFMGSPIALVISSWLSLVLMTTFFCRREQLIVWVEAEVLRRAATATPALGDTRPEGGKPAPSESASFAASGRSMPEDGSESLTAMVDEGQAGSAWDTLLPALGCLCRQRLERLVRRALRRHLAGRAMAGVGGAHASAADGSDAGSVVEDNHVPEDALRAATAAGRVKSAPLVRKSHEALHKVAAAVEHSDSGDDEADAAAASVDNGLEEADMDSVLLHTWSGWNWRVALAKWPEFLALGLPGAVMTTLEWGTFEANAVFAGWLSVADLASHSALAQTGAVAFMVPLGLSVAVAVRIGALMGEGRHKDAKMTVLSGVASGAVYTAINAAVLIGLRDGWGSLFTSSPDVVRRVGLTMPFMALFNVFDTGQAVLSGIIRGIGRQALGAAGNLLAYCGVGLASSYSIAIVGGMGLPGIWLGSVVGASLACLFLTVALRCSDWKALSDLAISRALGTTAASVDERELLAEDEESGEVELTRLAE